MSTPRKRWYQFSLKSLLVLFVLGSVSFGLYYIRIGRYQATVAALRKAGATMQFTGPLGGSSIVPERVTTVQAPAGADAAEIIRLARYLPDLARLHLDGSNVRDEDLAVLASFPALASLSIVSTGITDAGLAELHNVKTLKAVHLGETFLPAESIRALEDATGCHVEVKVLQPLSEGQHAALRQILDGGGEVYFDENGVVQSIYWEPLDVKRLVLLAKFPTLRNLHRSGSLAGVTDAWLEPIGSFRQLHSLRFIGASVSDHGLSHIADLTSLYELQVAAGAATGENVEPWKPMRQLHRLSIEGDELTSLDFVHPDSYQTVSWLTIACPKLERLPHIDWAALPNLQGLELECPSITNGDLARFTFPSTLSGLELSGRLLDAASLASLESLIQKEGFRLVFRDSGLTDEAWIALNALSPADSHLELQGTPPPNDRDLAGTLTAFTSTRVINVKLSDDHLAALAAMPRLDRIRVARCDLSAIDVAILAGCPSLTHLVLESCPMADGDAESLRRLLPNCKIEIH